MSESNRPYSTHADGHYQDPVFGRIWIKDITGMSATKKDLKGRYCPKLYTWLEVDMHGRAWMCCPSWLPYSIGNVLEESIEEMWNGEKAQTLRKQIFTGDWNYCQHEFCPEIASDNLPFIKDASHPIEKEILSSETTIAPLPTNINFSNDESCNLKCPSCRTDKLLFTEGPLYEKRKLINDKLVEEFLTEPTNRQFSIFVTGSGDPFASRIYREMLFDIDGKNFPNLQVNMQCNGVMFTPKNWEKIHKIHNNLGSVRISFDAGTKDTYENKTRLNGDWDLLLKNCDFLNEKQKQFPKFKIHYDFVVQVDNYTEMVDYATLILDRYDMAADINFSLVTDWGTWPKDVYEEKCIWKETHPEHDNFLQCLKDPIFKNPKIKLGNVHSYWKKANEEN
jgi:organic radical activating enzyme